MILPKKGRGRAKRWMSKRLRGDDSDEKDNVCTALRGEHVQSCAALTLMHGIVVSLIHANTHRQVL